MEIPPSGPFDPSKKILIIKDSHGNEPNPPGGPLEFDPEREARQILQPEINSQKLQEAISQITSSYYDALDGKIPELQRTKRVERRFPFYNHFSGLWFYNNSGFKLDFNGNPSGAFKLRKFLMKVRRQGPMNKSIMDQGSAQGMNLALDFQGSEISSVTLSLQAYADHFLYLLRQPKGDNAARRFMNFFSSTEPFFDEFSAGKLTQNGYFRTSLQLDLTENPLAKLNRRKYFHDTRTLDYTTDTLRYDRDTDGFKNTGVTFENGKKRGIVLSKEEFLDILRSVLALIPGDRV